MVKAQRTETRQANFNRQLMVIGILRNSGRGKLTSDSLIITACKRADAKNLSANIAQPFLPPPAVYEPAQVDGDAVSADKTPRLRLRFPFGVFPVEEQRRPLLHRIAEKGLDRAAAVVNFQD